MSSARLARICAPNAQPNALEKEVRLLPVTRDEKEQQIVRLTEEVKGSQVIIWTSYRGLPMPKLNDLRKALRPHHAEFHVVKNTLARLALERAGLPASRDMLVEPTAATFIDDDIAAAVRALNEFVVANKEVTIKGGLAGQRVLTAAEVPALATLPSRQVLLAQVLGGLNAPVSGLVNVLAGTMRGLVNVLQAQVKKMEEAGA
jgi:large subunit ribosomal protein L10